MPIDARIPLMGRERDPNQFGNTLAQILRLNELRRSADRQESADLAAAEETNSLRDYIRSPQTPEDMQRLGVRSPGAMLSMQKAQGGIEKNQAQTEKAKIEAYLQKLEAFGQLASSAVDEPSYQQAREQAQQLGSVDGWPRRFDPRWKEQAIAKSMKIKDQLSMKLKEEDTASKIKYRDSMQGQPMVMQTPGGAYTYPKDDPTAVTRMDTGPSAAEQQEANQQFQTDQAEIGADARTEAARISAQGRVQSRQQLPPAQLANVKNKLQTIGLLKQQVQNIRSKFDPLKGTYSAGPGGDYLPTEGGQSFDASVAALSPILRQLTRTPGEGAMSDYEAKLAEALLPSRGKYEAVTEQQIGQIEDMIKQLESGYMGMLPSGAQPTMEPGADPGMTLEQIDAELKRRKGMAVPPSQ